MSTPAGGGNLKSVAGRIAFELGKTNERGLTEAVMQFHGLQVVAGKAEANGFESAVTHLGHRLNPDEAFGFASVLEGKVLFEIVITGEQRGRRAANGLPGFANRDLL